MSKLKLLDRDRLRDECRRSTLGSRSMADVEDACDVDSRGLLILVNEVDRHVQITQGLVVFDLEHENESQ